MRLTVEEAKQQGYTQCGIKSDSWQSLIDLDDVKDFDPLETKLFLADKDEKHPMIDADTIKELLAEHIHQSYSDDTGDDTDDVYNIVNSIDFESTALMINKNLQKKSFWWLSDIELIY